MYVLCHLFSNLKLAHTGGWCWPNGRTCAANGNQSQSRILWDTPSNFKAAILLPKQFSGTSRIQTQPTMLSGPTLVKLLHYYFSSAWRALSAAPVSLQNPLQQPTVKDIPVRTGLPFNLRQGTASESNKQPERLEGRGLMEMLESTCPWSPCICTHIY